MSSIAILLFYIFFTSLSNTLLLLYSSATNVYSKTYISTNLSIPNLAFIWEVLVLKQMVVKHCNANIG